MSKYSNEIFRAAQTFELDKITGQRLKQTCMQGKSTAAGLDGWDLADWKCLSDYSFELLANLLNLIEEGCPWPKGVLKGKVAFLSKKDEEIQNFEVEEYRALLILAVLYRKWATLRLEDLKGWIQSWQLPEIFAGIPGKGAEGAWWLTALDIEWAKLFDEWLSGGALDMYKCFDQLSRELLQEVLHAAGAPPQIIRAYMNFHDNLIVHNSLAQGLGAGYFKPMSIPQGCPFSMCFIALLARPWILQMRNSTCEGKVSRATKQKKPEGATERRLQTCRFTWFSATRLCHKVDRSTLPRAPGCKPEGVGLEDHPLW